MIMYLHVLLLAGAQPSIKGIFGKEWCSSLWDRRNESREDELAIDVDLYSVSPYKVALIHLKFQKLSLREMNPFI